jgi:predicted DCC family thiol-disulfide oxidoreductase YuxK
MEDPTKPKLDVHYDGDCALCRAVVGTLDASSQQEIFSMNDITAGKLPEGVTYEEVMRNMYVVDEHGKHYAGIDGVIRILEAYPQRRWLASLLQTPGIHALGSFGYWLIARTRKIVPWQWLGIGVKKK